MPNYENLIGRTVTLKSGLSTYSRYEDPTNGKNYISNNTMRDLIGKDILIKQFHGDYPWLVLVNQIGKRYTYWLGINTLVPEKFNRGVWLDAS